MPLRTPEETGTRRTWSRRFGINDFPPAGGLSLDGRAGDITADDFRALENARYEGKRVISRGGQRKDTTDPVDGCVMGLIDVDGSQAFLIGSDDVEQRLDRYYADQVPAYVTPALAGTEPLPQLASAKDPLVPRDCFINYSGKVLAAVRDSLTLFGQVYEVSFPPPDTPITDFVTRTKMVKQFDLPDGDVVSSWVWKYEQDNANNSVPVLYMGSLTTGLVYRWDGVNLTTDTLTALPGTDRIILGVFQSDIIAIRSGGFATKRNFKALDGSGQWNVALTGDIVAQPMCCHEIGGAFVIGGNGTDISIWPGVGDCVFESVRSISFLAALCTTDMQIMPTGELGLAWNFVDGSTGEGRIGLYTPTAGLIADPFGDGALDGYAWTCETNDAHAGAFLVVGKELYVTAPTNQVQADEVQLLRLRINERTNNEILHTYSVGASPFTPPADMVAV